MNAQLKELEEQSQAELDTLDSLDALEAYRVKWLGRKGAITDILRAMKDAPPEERPVIGQGANRLKTLISDAVDAKKADMEAQNASTPQQTVDFSLPGRRPRTGHQHLITQITNEMVDIFTQLGYQVAEGPDIETEYYNFDSLNTPADHPARDSHDTFYVEPGVVLRTHTSPVQMHIMEQHQPPVAVVVPGRVYRVDYDASHSPMFNQLEGLLVDQNVTFGDLKGTINHFIHTFFGKKVKTRFRPHFFPFTEPSAEVDVSCSVCEGSGCRLCKNSGWIEILGCGMVDPEVFKYADYDSEKYSGFAFGMGIDRIALLRHSINTIHHLYENDLRFLEQF
ncbi:MAG: phenylalanine--tRNA ligase subunit alpha [Candidatus Hydrogenedentota bacterium]